MSEAALDQQTLGEDDPQAEAPKPKRGRPSKRDAEAAMLAWKREFILRRVLQQTPETARQEANKAWDDHHDDQDMLDFLRLNASAPMGIGGLVRTGRSAKRALP